MDKYEALAKILEDEDLTKEVITESVEQTVKNLASRGIDFSADELKELSAFVHAGTDNSGEMDEVELESVSGGINLWKYILPFIPRLGPIMPRW